MIREARPGELAAVGDLRVAAYEAGGFLNPGYAPQLRALGTQGDGTVLVAIAADDPPAGAATATGPAGAVTGASADGGDGAGKIAGTIMLVTWPRAGELVGGPDEAEIRALAVAPGVQQGGVGTGLLRTALNWAELAGARRVVLSTLPAMRAAHRLYERNGFRRLPDRDWSPVPGVQLLAYVLELGTAEDGPGT
ncbi:MAG TPA: GNAT family N-acetyltransferase [Streptosporangiaceae bacterium]